MGNSVLETDRRMDGQSTSARVELRFAAKNKISKKITVLTSSCRKRPEGSKRREVSQNLRASSSFLFFIQSFYYFVTSCSIIHQHSPSSRLTLGGEPPSHILTLTTGNIIFISLLYFFLFSHTIYFLCDALSAFVSQQLTHHRVFTPGPRLAVEVYLLARVWGRLSRC